MNYRQLEEAINKWTLELEEQEKIFLQQATQVNAWDRLLVDNGEKVHTSFEYWMYTLSRQDILILNSFATSYNGNFPD